MHPLCCKNLSRIFLFVYGTLNSNFKVYVVKAKADFSLTDFKLSLRFIVNIDSVFR
jgi:hypothetical protein